MDMPTNLFYYLLQQRKCVKCYGYPRAFQVSLVVKNLPARARDAGEEGSILVQNDPLLECMATHSSTLA